MTYPYIVNKDGIWYPAGTEVPEDTVVNDTKTKENEILPFDYTKTDINRMTTAELKALAENVGIENAEETSGSELKKLLIEYFGL